MGCRYSSFTSEMCPRTFEKIDIRGLAFRNVNEPLSQAALPRPCSPQALGWAELSLPSQRLRQRPPPSRFSCSGFRAGLFPTFTWFPLSQNLLPLLTMLFYTLSRLSFYRFYYLTYAKLPTQNTCIKFSSVGSRIPLDQAPHPPQPRSCPHCPPCTEVSDLNAKCAAFRLVMFDRGCSLQIFYWRNAM